MFDPRQPDSIQAMSVRLLLVRHGRVDFTSKDFVESTRGRQYDPPLNNRGRQQARRLAARLMLMDAPAVIASSPFRRCTETLEPYLTASGFAAEPVADLGEVFIGSWEGLGFEEIVGKDKDLARKFREQEPMFSLAPGGESGSQLRERVVPAVEGLLRGVPDGIVLAVTHGGVINAYLGHVMGIEHDMFFLPENASINSVLAESGRREVRFLNDVRHLTDPALFDPPAGVGHHVDGMAEPT
jgi:broad specificity phosphatase PhoE